MDTNLSVAYGPQIAAAATRHNLDPRLLAAVAAQETGGPGADSGRNVVGDGGHGHGVFQIDDRWHAFARTPEAMDPAANADYAAGLLESNLHQYGGDLRAALSAYNAGSPTAQGTTTDWGDGRPVGYADSVLRHYAQLGGSNGTPEQITPDDAGEEAYAFTASPGAAGYCPAGEFALSLPAYRPIPHGDGRDLAVVPSVDAGGDDDDQVSAVLVPGEF